MSSGAERTQARGLHFESGRDHLVAGDNIGVDNHFGGK